MKPAKPFFYGVASILFISSAAVSAAGSWYSSAYDPKEGKNLAKSCKTFSTAEDGTFCGDCNKRGGGTERKCLDLNDYVGNDRNDMSSMFWGGTDFTYYISDNVKECRSLKLGVGNTVELQAECRSKDSNGELKYHYNKTLDLGNHLTNNLDGGFN